METKFELLYCEEWHGKKAETYAENCEFFGGPTTEFGAKALELEKMHSNFAEAIRATIKVLIDNAVNM